MQAERYPAPTLRHFSKALLLSAGLEPAKSEVVAETLVLGDLMGHDTHGLALLPNYLRELGSGGMNKSGTFRGISDRPAALCWDGGRLPGPWLVRQAQDLAAQRAREMGSCTVVIRRSHHIACLAVYLKRATDAGLLMLLACSDPCTASVAPHGGLDPVMTPNPLAAGFPTRDLPVLLDVSTSATTNGLTGRLHRQGGRLPAAWVIDSNGEACDDPAVLFTKPPGTILPLGGLESGHKGYALSLLVEALTGGLAGHGRADPGEGWGATVFLQIIDPQAFAGVEEFQRQTSAVTERCRASRPRDPSRPVRTPGEQGLKRAAEQAQSGVALHPSILPALQPWADKLGVALPQPG